MITLVWFALVSMPDAPKDGLDDAIFAVLTVYFLLDCFRAIQERLPQTLSLRLSLGLGVPLRLLPHKRALLLRQDCLLLQEILLLLC